LARHSHTSTGTGHEKDAAVKGAEAAVTVKGAEAVVTVPLPTADAATAVQTSCTDIPLPALLAFVIANAAALAGSAMTASGAGRGIGTNPASVPAGHATRMEAEGSTAASIVKTPLASAPRATDGTGPDGGP